MASYSLLEKVLFPPNKLNKEKLRNSLAGKTVLITGASSGIGEHLAYLLADLDIHLILAGRRSEKLSTMKADLQRKGARVSIFAGDLRKEAELEGLLSLIKEIPGGLDLVVSNAGISIKRSISASVDRYHDFTRTMAINYFAPVKIILAVIPLLQKNQGQIINISTINVLLNPFPYWAAYQASKSAFDTWFRSASPELNALGIKTTSIYLPLVKTPMILPTTEYQRAPAMDPMHVAKIIAKSMYTQQRLYRPWWLFLGQLASLIFRGTWDMLLSRIIKTKEK